MRYLSVTEIAKKWNISERNVRNYCAHGRVQGAFLLERLGKFRRTPKNQSVPIKRKNIRLHCWTFCKNKEQANTPVAFTIRHKLI